MAYSFISRRPRCDKNTLYVHDFDVPVPGEETSLRGHRSTRTKQGNGNLAIRPRSPARSVAVLVPCNSEALRTLGGISTVARTRFRESPSTSLPGDPQRDEDRRRITTVVSRQFPKWGQ